MKKLHIAYYVTAHGYGHGVRSCDILGALLKAHSGVKVTVTTDLPASFLRSRVCSENLVVRPGAFDVGMVQKDSIRVDVDATLEQALQLVDERPKLVDYEAEMLRGEGADLVVADIPSIPLEAAAEAGIPAVAVGNFSWDWIYSPFIVRDPRWRPVIRMFEEGYRKAKLLLKLPFSPAMSVFQKHVDIPLLAKPGRARRPELSQLTGADGGKRWVLLSFTALDWDETALRAVEALKDYEFFTVKPLDWPGRKNIHAIDRMQIGFSDVLASSDVAVTKPGFGILSDCVANAKPIVYADREDFIEYPLLARELKRFLRNAHIPAADLYAGRLGDALAAIETAPAPKETLPGGGAEKTADILMGLAG
jgi:L-arabinokinase